MILALSCVLCAPSVAFASHVADVSGYANGEVQCSVCHTGDLAPEHTKPTASTAGAGCRTCHDRAHDLYVILAGNWDGTCSDPVCHAVGGNAPPVHKTYCLACHDVSQPDFATSKVSFTPIDPVDRDTACKACHAPGLVGTHPYHQIGSNCGSACHPTWGRSLASATPLYTDPGSGASFAAAGSKETSAALLHTIHANPRWPAGVDTPGSACASCHATAACGACHTGAIPATHAGHSGSDQDANPAWSGLVGYGVVDGDQSQHTAFVDSVQCSSAGCHDIARSAATTSRDIEDYNHAAGGDPDDPSAVNAAITATGLWRYRASSRYSGGRMSYANTAGTSLSATFAGERIEIVSERDPYRGTATVWIDGVSYGTIDTYAPTSVVQAVVFSADLPAGEHTITVYPTGAKSSSARGTFVVIDGFRVYEELPETVVPACSSCHADRIATH